jgi:LPXTG-motif cell wall-anchored protein
VTEGRGSSGSPGRSEGEIVARYRFAVAALLAVLVLSFGGVALAQDYNNPPPSVGGETENRGPSVSGAGESLPFTGADVTMFVIVGLGAIGAGLLIVRKVRRTS